MPSKHSKFSPSAAKIWLNCPKAVHIYSEIARSSEPNAAAAEGTKYHDMMESFLKEHKPEFFKDPAKNDYKTFLKLSGFTKNKLSLNLYTLMVSLIEEIESVTGKKQYYYEKKLNLDSVIPGCFGTADGIIKAEKHLFVFDYKFGFVDVEADSEQLLLYAIGALNKYDTKDKINTVSTIIIQPKKTRLLKTKTFTKKGIQALEKKYNRQAKRMLTKNPKCIVGPWCDYYAPCKPYCKAYQNKLVSETADFFKKYGV